MKNPKYIRKLDQVSELEPEERARLQPITSRFVFRSNAYYQSLINWDDPEDPIRRIVIPDVAELNEWGKLDASDESAYTVVPGLEHKYEFTALLLVNDVCGAYCRFCFRKRLFMDGNDEVVRDISEGIKYLRSHHEITNVLLTGGDPLLMSTPKLENILRQIREIEHVQIIRIGTKMPAFNPFRILDDPTLLATIDKYSSDDKKIYIMAHFNHPRELTKPAIKALHLLQKSGAITVNQTPLIKGINDNPLVLAKLFRKLSFIGVPPYYVFQCRPTLGNQGYSVPIEQGFHIFEQARMLGSGLAKRARYVMSHSTGKIEVVGMTQRSIFMRYHRAANRKEKGKFIVMRRNPHAYWFDDYRDYIQDEYLFEDPRKSHAHHEFREGATGTKKTPGKKSSPERMEHW